MRRKKRNKKLTAKERLAALLIAGLCVPLFLAFFFAYGKRTGKPERDAPAAPAEESAAQPPASSPEPIAPSSERQPEVQLAPTADRVAEPPVPSVPEIALAPPPARRPAKPEPSPLRAGNIICVIDDAGNSLRELEPFLRFPGPLTIAVLPGLPRSAEAARLAREAGKEVFLHQPMQALGGADPCPGAIYAGMSADEVRAILEKNAAEIGPIAGINNHQGSLITQDEEIMRTVLEFCRDNGLCFLDSRTTADTVVPKISRELGFDIAERNVFLDNDRSKAAITGSLEQGLAIALEKPAAIMIGHAWSPELAGILSESYAGLNAQGYTFISVLGIMRMKITP
ncbi:MAG: divergent polysaccharide deacetylase family protein [Spirochaetaceae bacterium]|nr:divergent polysaccharide deacetylase family protein [Spirochaetaceae bacterium]